MKNIQALLLAQGVAVFAAFGLMTGCDQAVSSMPDQEQQGATSLSASSYKTHGITVEDVVLGSGKVAQKGDTVAVHYLGQLASNGKKFDSSYDRNKAFTFKLGGGQVIEGWDKGLIGMKEGGKRVLLIPPDKGYGANGAPPVIPGGATLRFEVELLSVQSE